MKLKYPRHLEKGMEFGRLTVVEVDAPSKVGKESQPSIWRYMCRCSCPQKTIVSVHRIQHLLVFLILLGIFRRIHD